MAAGGYTCFSMAWLKKILFVSMISVAVGPVNIFTVESMFTTVPIMMNIQNPVPNLMEVNENN